jgi:hypothetical protein
MSTLCGLRSKSQYKTIPTEQESKHQRLRADEYGPRRTSTDVRTPKIPKTPSYSKFREELSEKGSPKGKHQQSPKQPSPKGKQKQQPPQPHPQPPVRRRKKSTDFQWAREDQLSIILEILDGDKESRRSTPRWEQKEKEGPRKRPSLDWDKVPRLEPFKRTRFLDQRFSLSDHLEVMSSRKTSPGTSRPIEAPPTDVSLFVGQLACCASDTVADADCSGASKARIHRSRR